MKGTFQMILYRSTLQQCGCYIAVALLGIRHQVSFKICGFSGIEELRHQMIICFVHFTEYN